MCKRLVYLLVIGLVLGISGPVLAGVIVAEELLVDLRAEDLAYGTAAGTWTNHGTLDDFMVMGSPVVEDLDGRKCVTFDGSSYFEGPETTDGIHGNGTRSIEIWAYNGPDFVAEETMVSWSHRGGPDGTNLGFNYGNNTTWGAVGHWGSPDMGWSDEHSPAPAANNWWYLVYTYDGTTVRLYVNGEANTAEDAALNTHGPNLIRVAAQADNSGADVDAGLSFTGSIAEVRIHDGVLSPTDIANNFVSKPGEPIAGDPNPTNGQTDVPRDSVLSWAAGPFAATHDVYFGTGFDDVNAADAADPLGVLVSEGQVASAYGPDGVLEFAQTYYWRVDEVNAAPDSTIFPGDVWSFTVEPLAYPVENIVATTNVSSLPGIEPGSTVDGSGLNADDQHSAVDTDMWAGTPPTGELAYLQCEFDKVYKLYELMVWNYNVTFEPMLGFGFKDVTIETSEDGENWTVLKDVVFAQATAKADYTANTTVDLEGVAAKYVRLTANSGYGTTGQFGLSEVRFLYTPVLAREPESADGATDVSVDAILDWRAGREAVSHEVALGTDAEALAVIETVTDSQYNPGGLDLGTTYYWQISEVNEAEAISTWTGDLWSFSTQESIVIDDFESYNDDDNLIYETWLDGWVNETGSTVGYLEAPFAEQTMVHGGKQAMPLFYDNTGGLSVSEADLTLSPGQNWTQAGVTTLVVNFYGSLENDAAQVYVKIDGTKVTGGSTTMALWKQWDIDLAATGANLQNVKSVTVGVEGNGSGVIYVDDVALYAAAPAVATPVDPGTDGLAAQYTFEDNANDVTGNGYDGTPMNDPLYEDAVGELGRAISFDGINDHVELPIGSLIASLSDMTVATWVNFPNVGGTWQRIFDFGTSNTEGYMFLCPRTGGAGPLRFAITASAGGDAESFVDTPSDLPAGWHHVATVIDSADMTMSLYVDGALAASGATATLPQDLGSPTQNWLGRSQYDADAYFTGLLADLSIYNRVLSPGEIRYLAGDR